MINNELLGYVKKQLSLGIGREVVTNNLKGAGWNDADINEVFSAIATPATSTSTPNPTPLPASPVASPVASSVVPNITPTLQTPEMPQMPQMQNVSLGTAHTKSHKMIPVVVILILLVLAGGAAAYAYYSGAFVTLPGLVSEYLEKFKDNNTSASYEFSIGVDISGIKNATNELASLGVNSTKLSLNAKGSYDISDINNLKNSLIISGNLDPLSFEVETRVLNSTLYAKLTKFPALAMLPTQMISLYENKWFSFLVTKDANINKRPTYTAEQKAQLFQLLKDANIIKKVTRLNTETVGGESSYHFAFDFDRDALTAWMVSSRDYMRTIDKDNLEFSDFDPKSFSKTMNQIKDFKGEIWIGRGDKLLHKLAVNFDVQLDPLLGQQITQEGPVKFNMTAILSDYNKPVSITAPADSTSFSEFMSGIINGSLEDVKQNGDKTTSALDQLEESRQKGKEAMIKANMSSLRAQAELFWIQDDSYLGFCLSKEVKDVRKAIEDSGGTGFVCKDASQKYAIGVKLFKDKENFCVDSAGTAKITTTLPISTLCPAK